MRYSCLAVGTLSALAGGSLAAGAQTAPSLPTLSEEPVVTGDRTPVAPEIDTRAIAPVAAPERVASGRAGEWESGESPTPTFSASRADMVASGDRPVELHGDRPVELNAGLNMADEELLLDGDISTVPVPVEVESLEIAASEEVQSTQPLSENEVALLVEEEATVADALLPQGEVDITALEGTTARSATLLASEDTQAEGTCGYLAQGGVRRCPRPEPIAPIALPDVDLEPESSPALSIYIPVGYGADNNTVFISSTYQASVREDDGSVATTGVGVGLGDADRAVGLELSYAFETDEDFGEGGFNAKLHRRFDNDLGIAAGWNGFLNIGRNDFEQSLYGVATKVFRTQESVNEPFSRVAVTFGVGDGQFRSNGDVEDGDNGVNVFGNVAVRLARPVSLITEWTGQDLAVGLSVAPFRNFPLVITPAVRDIAGAGDEARFVLGTGMSFRF